MKLEAAFLAATVILFFSCSILYAGQRGDEKVNRGEGRGQTPEFPCGDSPPEFRDGGCPPEFLDGVCPRRILHIVCENMCRLWLPNCI